MNSKLLLEAKNNVASRNGFQTWLHVEEERMIARFTDEVSAEYEKLLRIGKTEKQRRDYFAGLAMQGMISKMPFIDEYGELGLKKTPEQLNELKSAIAESAWHYADWMLYVDNKNDNS